MQNSKQGSVAHQTKLVRDANRGRWLIRQRSYVLTDTAALTAVTKHQSMLISHSEVRSLSQSLQYRVAIEALGVKYLLGAAVVGWAVQGAAVVGLGVAARDSNRTRRVATQGSVAHQTKLSSYATCVWPMTYTKVPLQQQRSALSAYGTSS
eukprot:20428-Heterococcus_DN1.PRE.1